MESGNMAERLPGDEIAYLSALALRDRYWRRDLSPVEVAEATLQRIERLNPRYTAFITVTPDLAMAQARDAEAAYLRGDPGPLAGVPLSIKDLTPTRGIRTTRGSLVDPDWVPTEDPPFVERSYAAGGVMLGKTNTPELGWKGDSGNRIVGPTHNPWRHGRTAGGSSGGAAAAVALGLGPLAQGSDGAGSIRIPAAFCGIFGIKPSFGLVPQYPASAVGDLSHLGPMTRTVRDAALWLNVVAGADARDRLSWSSGIDYLAACEGGVAGLRVAVSPTLGYAWVRPDVRTAFERAARRFVDLGCEVEEVDPPLESPWPILDLIWASAMAGYFAETFANVRDLIDPGLFKVVEQGQRILAKDLLAAQLRRNAYYRGMRQFMERFDLLLTPTLPITAFRAGADEPDADTANPDMPLDWTPFTYPFNLTGQPAATVPCGFGDDGLPVGLQIVGRWKDDSTVLRAAAAFEEAQPWAAARSPLDAGSES
jgi:aspartyl-tRNA(Asn)/glutamyl-tRNA(Gln) amidotransferase subunit A